MLQFNLKVLQAFQVVKTEATLADHLARIDKNIANLATLSQKSFKYITRLATLTADEEVDIGKVTETYESLAVYADKLRLCCDMHSKLAD